MAPLASVVEEGRRITDVARDGDVDLRVLGGVGIWMHCPGSRELLKGRRHGDVDLAAPSQQADQVDALFRSLSYEPNRTFNKLHKGEGRLMYLDADNERRIDVFLDRFEMCHALDLRDRFGFDFPTLCLADLALTKLQIVQITEKDLVDLTALFAEHPVGDRNDETVDASRVTTVCAADWGWYRTVRGNLQRVASGVDAGARGGATELIERIDAAPKSRRWKLRAMIGERVPWYQLPEEV